MTNYIFEKKTERLNGAIKDNSGILDTLLTAPLQWCSVVESYTQVPNEIWIEQGLTIQIIVEENKKTIRQISFFFKLDAVWACDSPTNARPKRRLLEETWELIAKGIAIIGKIIGWSKSTRTQKTKDVNLFDWSTGQGNIGVGQSQPRKQCYPKNLKEGWINRQTSTQSISNRQYPH